MKNKIRSRNAIIVSCSRHLLPLFPLRVVVFPRTPLPLHIFEERYKEMVGDAIRANSEFGIVLAKDDGIVNAGCTVVVEEGAEDISRRPHGHPDARESAASKSSGSMKTKPTCGAKWSFLTMTIPGRRRRSCRKKRWCNTAAFWKRASCTRERSGAERPAAQLSTGAGAAGSGFPERAAAQSLGIAAPEAVDGLSGASGAPVARSRPHAQTGAAQRARNGAFRNVRVMFSAARTAPLTRSGPRPQPIALLALGPCGYPQPGGFRAGSECVPPAAVALRAGDQAARARAGVVQLPSEIARGIAAGHAAFAALPAQS